MKKLITANDIREAHARGELAMSVVLRASIITPEAREVADLLGFTITECDESIPVTASVPASASADKTESQRIRETIIAQLPEVKWFTEFGHLNRGDMLTSEQHRCHNEKKKFQRRV